MASRCSTLHNNRNSSQKIGTWHQIVAHSKNTCNFSQKINQYTAQDQGEVSRTFRGMRGSKKNFHGKLAQTK